MQNVLVDWFASVSETQVVVHHNLVEQAHGRIVGQLYVEDMEHVPLLPQHQSQLKIGRGQGTSYLFIIKEDDHIVRSGRRRPSEHQAMDGSYQKEQIDQFELQRVTTIRAAVSNAIECMKVIAKELVVLAVLEQQSETIVQTACCESKQTFYGFSKRDHFSTNG